MQKSQENVSKNSHEFDDYGFIEYFSLRKSKSKDTMSSENATPRGSGYSNYGMYYYSPKYASLQRDINDNHKLSKNSSYSIYSNQSNSVESINKPTQKQRIPLKRSNSKLVSAGLTVTSLGSKPKPPEPVPETNDMTSNVYVNGDEKSLTDDHKSESTSAESSPQHIKLEVTADHVPSQVFRNSIVGRDGDMRLEEKAGSRKPIVLSPEWDEVVGKTVKIEGTQVLDPSVPPNHTKMESPATALRRKKWSSMGMLTRQGSNCQTLYDREGAVDRFGGNNVSKTHIKYREQPRSEAFYLLDDYLLPSKDKERRLKHLKSESLGYLEGFSDRREFSDHSSSNSSPRSKNSNKENEDKQKPQRVLVKRERSDRRERPERRAMISSKSLDEGYAKPRHHQSFVVHGSTPYLNNLSRDSSTLPPGFSLHNNQRSFAGGVSDAPPCLPPRAPSPLPPDPPYACDSGGCVCAQCQKTKRHSMTFVRPQPTRTTPLGGSLRPRMAQCSLSPEYTVSKFNFFFW